VTTATWLCRDALPADRAAVRRIYNEGIADRVATLDEDPKTAADIDEWFAAHTGRYAVLAAQRERGEVAGWAALHRSSHRCAYDGVAALSIYVSRDSRGTALGTLLLPAPGKRARPQAIT